MSGGAAVAPLPVLRVDAGEAELPELSALPPEAAQAVERYAAQIDLSQPAAYGARCQQELGTFVTLALEQMAQADPTPVTGALDALCDAVRDADPVRAARGLLSRLLGGTWAVRRAYRRAAPQVSARADELSDLRVRLLRDQALLRRLLEKNEALYRRLAGYVVCGRQRLRMQGAGEERERFARRLSDLELTRTASLQLTAQLRLLLGAEETASERIEATLRTTIPLWRAQMMVALGLSNAREAARLDEATRRALEPQLRAGARHLSRAARTGALREAAAQGEAVTRALQEARGALLLAAGETARARATQAAQTPAPQTPAPQTPTS